MPATPLPHFALIDYEPTDGLVGGEIDWAMSDPRGQALSKAYLRFKNRYELLRKATFQLGQDHQRVVNALVYQIRELEEKVRRNDEWNDYYLLSAKQRDEEKVRALEESREVIKELNQAIKERDQAIAERDRHRKTLENWVKKLKRRQEHDKDKMIWQVDLDK